MISPAATASNAAAYYRDTCQNKGLKKYVAKALQEARIIQHAIDIGRSMENSENGVWNSSFATNFASMRIIRQERDGLEVRSNGLNGGPGIARTCDLGNIPRSSRRPRHLLHRSVASIVLARDVNAIVGPALRFSRLAFSYTIRDLNANESPEICSDDG